MSVRKSFLSSLGLFFFLITFQQANAQIGLRMTLNRKNYMRYEPIFAKLLIRNYSGHPLAFGNGALKGKVSFHIETVKGDQILSPFRNIDDMVGIILDSGITKELVIPITDYYRIVKNTSYRIKCVISHSQLNNDYQSNTVTFKISKAIETWSREVGVPNLFINKSTKEEIPVRKVKILNFFDGQEKFYYLKIEDKKNIYKVVRIGHDIGGSQPKCEIDFMSRIHILLRASPKVFSYFRYDINGKREEKEVFIKDDSTPILIRDPEKGSIMVSGGRQALEGYEFIEDQQKKFPDPKKRGKRN